MSKRQVSSGHTLPTDPLQGAPGHSNAGMDIPSGPQRRTKSYAAKPAKVEMATEQKSQGDDRSVFAETMKTLGAAIGPEKMHNMRKLVSSNAKDAEAKIQEILNSAKASLPQDFSLAKFTPGKRRLTQAAGIAGGIGVLLVLREYFSGEAGAPLKVVAAAKKTKTAAAKPAKKKALSGKAAAKASKVKSKKKK